ncbi:MAG: hypothetical protein ABIT61_13470 [Steroidobacteraceae bacterium]
MNAAMIRHLVAKDWSFQRLPVALGGVGGAIGLALMIARSDAAFYVGVVLLASAVISLGIYLLFMSVVNERTEGMLPFVMSLPIGVREYTAAKLLANMLLFLLPWAALAAGAVTVILIRDSVPDGLVPYAVVLLLHLLTGYVLSLGTALVTSSPGWTIAVAGTANIVFQGFMYWTSHLPDVAPTLAGPVAVWSASIRWLILAELLAIVGILCVTWMWRTRQTDFT